MGRSECVKQSDSGILSSVCPVTNLPVVGINFKDLEHPIDGEMSGCRADITYHP